jgi:hypothetical protein
MIREGQGDVTLNYITESPKRIAISSFTEGESKISTVHLALGLFSWQYAHGNTSIFSLISSQRKRKVQTSSATLIIS